MDFIEHHWTWKWWFVTVSPPKWALEGLLVQVFCLLTVHLATELPLNHNPLCDSLNATTTRSVIDRSLPLFQHHDLKILQVRIVGGIQSDRSSWCNGEACLSIKPTRASASYRDETLENIQSLLGMKAGEEDKNLSAFAREFFSLCVCQ